MAKCKYCHETISRLDKEVCPFCGGIKPLEGTDTSTQDVTKVIDQLGEEVKIKHKKRIIAAILAVLVGFLGLHQIYMGKYKKGLIFGATMISFIGLDGVLNFFVFGLRSFWAFLIPYFLVEAFMIYVGFVILTNHTIQDGRGEFLE